MLVLNRSLLNREYNLMNVLKASVKNFHSILSRLALGSAQPPVQWVPGASTPAVKQQESETYHSPPTKAEC
jgi:hypothetical protein